MRAADMGHTHCLRALIGCERTDEEMGAMLNALSHGPVHAGQTALDIAVRRKHFEIVRLINSWPSLKEHFTVSEFHQEPVDVSQSTFTRI